MSKISLLPSWFKSPAPPLATNLLHCHYGIQSSTQLAAKWSRLKQRQFWLTPIFPPIAGDPNRLEQLQHMMRTIQQCMSLTQIKMTDFFVLIGSICTLPIDRMIVPAAIISK